MNHGTIKLGSNLTFYANTHTPSTGAAVDADAVPGYRVYEDETATPLLTGSMALLDDANTTGLYVEQIAVTTANGFEAGKSYCIRVTGVVGGVTGVELHYFDIQTRSLDDLSTLDAAGVRTAVGLASANLDTQLSGLETDIAALTVGEVAAAAAAGIDIAITKYANYAKTITGLTISASWTSMYVTIKRSKDEKDASAILQLIVTNPAAGSTDGVLRVNQALASVAQRTQGSLTVDQSAGTVAIALNDELTALLTATTKGNWYYDVKQVTASGSTQLKSGLVSIGTSVTRLPITE